MVLIRCAIIAVLATSSMNCVLSQVGKPEIITHSKKDYDGSVTNWDIQGSSTGRIYVANNDGLLIYDGHSWQKHQLPNKSIVRSVFEINDTIYVGGQDEVGFFAQSKTGDWKFHTLRNKIGMQHLPLEDVWDIVLHENKVFFVSVDRVYVLDGDENQIIFTGNPTFGLSKNDDYVYFNDIAEGVYRIVDGKKELVLPISEMGGNHATTLFGWDQSLLISTAKHELYLKTVGKPAKRIASEIQTYLSQNTVVSLYGDERQLVVGTQYGGLAVLDSAGQLRYTVQKSDGLQNNNIHGVATDNTGNLWAATSGGIDNILIGGKRYYLYPDGELRSSVYDIQQIGNRLYFGTTSGLYYQKLDAVGREKERFSFVEGSGGQVWGLDEIQGELCMAHNNGAFVLKEGTLKKISPGIGAWKFLLAPDQQHMYVGTYFGVDLYEKNENDWEFIKTYKYPNESCRIMVNGSGNDLWISHPYRGLYHMKIDENFNLITSEPYYGQKGLPSNQLNYVFEVNGKMLVAAEKGVYEYEELKDQFVPTKWLNDIISSDDRVRFISTDNYNQIWYLTETELCRFEIADPKKTKECITSLASEFVGGFEHMTIIGPTEVLICTEEGLLEYNISTDLKQSALAAEILAVSNRDTSYFVTEGEYDKPVYSYQHNEVSFVWTSRFPRPDVLFSYRLLPENENWTELETIHEATFSNLPHGDYRFEVKARVGDAFTEEPAIFEFVISPPWYRSKLAYAVYSILFLGLIASLLLIPNRRYVKEQAKLVDQKKATEQELEQLKIDKMQQEIDGQNTALASSTLHLVQKNTIIQKVKADIEHIKKTTSDAATKRELRKVLSTLSDDQKLEEDWESFAIHFDRVHTDFLKRLKADHPELSPKDLKLSAYLRMNLNTKEIAPLLNISVRGVEISRYRLRKKLQLNKEDNLNEWMLDF